MRLFRMHTDGQLLKCCSQLSVLQVHMILVQFMFYEFVPGREYSSSCQTIPGSTTKIRTIRYKLATVRSKASILHYLRVQISCVRGKSTIIV